MLLENRRIYIIDDNPENLLLMQMLLQREGARVGIKRFEVNLIDHLKSFAPIDVILLDIRLAGAASGFDIIEWIRAVPQFAAIPVIAVSAMDRADVVPQLVAKGFQGFISKPLNDETFPQLIDQVLQGESIW